MSENGAASQPVRGQILFCDDDPFFRELGAEVLAEAGFAITAAADGADALLHLEAKTFDLAIIDVQMPRVTGFEVLDKVRSGSAPDLPIIMITGDNDTAAIERAFDLGANSFMAKPFDWSLLVHHVRYVLKAARTHKECQDLMRVGEFLRSSQERLVSVLIEEAHKPLRNATNFTRIMREEADGPIGSAYYKTCLGELSRALETVTMTHLKLLHWSDTINEAVTINAEVIPLAPFVSQCIEAIEQRAASRRLILEWSLDAPPSLSLRADRALLAQAFAGVLGEAMNRSKTGGKIIVSVAAGRSGGFKVDILVSTPMLSAAQAGLKDASALRQAGRGPHTPARSELQISKVIAVAHGGSVGIAPDAAGGETIALQLPQSRIVETGTMRPAPLAALG